jgi:replication factor C subunit 2/4
MTDKALPIISNLMDTYQDTTRFVFTCNTSSKIIESIQSRCKILRFMRIDKPVLIKRLKNICEQEKIEYKKNGLDEIANISNGDMRNAINLLELTFNRYSVITNNNVYNACDIPQPHKLKDIIINGLNKKIKECIISIESLKSDGYTVNDIIFNIIYILKSSITDDIKDEDKMRVMELCSKYIYRMSKTKETTIQLYGFISELNR